LKFTKSHMKWLSRLFLAFVLTLALVVIVLKLTIVSSWVIPQNGMYPTLPGGSTFLGINKPYKSAGDVKRGDIVIFERFEKGDRYIYIWRVVGLPGDSVVVEDSRVTLNGKPLPLEKVRSEVEADILRETNGEVSYEVAHDRTTPEGLSGKFMLTVPEGHLFVLGDHRTAASDSRVMGPIPFSSVLARKW
jgi:signal peptidase I